MDQTTYGDLARSVHAGLRAGAHLSSRGAADGEDGENVTELHIGEWCGVRMRRSDED